MVTPDQHACAVVDGKVERTVAWGVQEFRGCKQPICDVIFQYSITRKNHF